MNVERYVRAYLESNKLINSLIKPVKGKKTSFKSWYETDNDEREEVEIYKRSKQPSTGLLNDIKHTNQH